jgi:hypothetical protein
MELKSSHSTRGLFDGQVERSRLYTASAGTRGLVALLIVIQFVLAKKWLNICRSACGSSLSLAEPCSVQCSGVCFLQVSARRAERSLDCDCDAPHSCGAETPLRERGRLARTNAPQNRPGRKAHEVHASDGRSLYGLAWHYRPRAVPAVPAGIDVRVESKRNISSTLIKGMPIQIYARCHGSQGSSESDPEPPL